MLDGFAERTMTGHRNLLVYQCDLCLKNKSLRLIPLIDSEKVLAAKLLKLQNKRVIYQPSRTCETCFTKLSYFKVKYKSIIKRAILLKFYEKMHSTSLAKDKDIFEETVKVDMDLDNCKRDQCLQKPLTSDALKIQSSSSSVESLGETEDFRMETCSNNYDCNCQSCQNKYGCLPILLEGIEQRSKSEDKPSTPATSSATDKPGTSRRILTCEFCNKTFSHKGDFNKHLRIHTKEQPFSCSICQRKFAHSSNLQRHIRLHSGQKPFVCGNCGRNFSRKDKLECHKRSRTCNEASSSSNVE